MNIVSLGRVNCGASPVQVSATKIRCSQVIICPIAGMTGLMYLGLSTLDKSTKAGVIKQFPIPPLAATAGAVNDTYVLEQPTGDGNSIDLSKLYIDGAVSGEGLIVSYMVR